MRIDKKIVLNKQGLSSHTTTQNGRQIIFLFSVLSLS